MFRTLVVSAVLIIVLMNITGLPTTVQAQESAQASVEAHGPDFCYYPWYRRQSDAQIVVLIILLLQSFYSIATAMGLASRISDARKHFLKQQLTRIARTKKCGVAGRRKTRGIKCSGH